MGFKKKRLETTVWRGRREASCGMADGPQSAAEMRTKTSLGDGVPIWVRSVFGVSAMGNEFVFGKLVLAGRAGRRAPR